LSNRAANFVVADDSNEVAVVSCDSSGSAIEAATLLAPEAPNFPG
jgi:hypothetical protein